MSWWEERVLPVAVDRALRGRPVEELRERACAPLAGRVLDVGFGSGLNLRHLPDAVTAVDAVEPSDRAWKMSERRRVATGRDVQRKGLDGQRLDLPDASYDEVLCTFTLCTIPDVVSALGEMRRVLRPAGRLTFLEHGASPDPAVARWQERLEPIHKRLAGGCHLTREVPALVESAGFSIVDLERLRVLGPGFMSPWTQGWIGRAARG